MSKYVLSSVEEQIKSYLTNPDTVGLAESSQYSYSGTLMKKLLPYCVLKGITVLDKSFEDRMEDYVVWLRASGLSAESTQHYLTITKGLFRFLGQKIEFTYRIPRADKQKWDLKQQNRWYSDIEVAKCLAYEFKGKNKKRDHILVRLFYETGARLSEISVVRRRNIILERKRIVLEVSKTVPRQAFFSPETAVRLESYFEEKGWDPIADADQRLFPGSNRIYKIICTMLNDLNLKHGADGRGPHTFRHFAATDLHYNKGMKLTSVASLLGDRPDTISGRYLHPTADQLQAEISRASGW